MAVIQKLRKSFGKSFFKTALPDLVDIQYGSYKDFLQADVEPSARKNIGLQKVFSSVFPIKDSGSLTEKEPFYLEITKEIIEKNNITSLMITHNMQDAITYGNRLIMLHAGEVIFDIKGEEKKKLTVEKLLEMFKTKDAMLSDKDVF